MGFTVIICLLLIVLAVSAIFVGDVLQEELSKDNAYKKLADLLKLGALSSVLLLTFAGITLFLIAPFGSKLRVTMHITFPQQRSWLCW